MHILKLFATLPLSVWMENTTDPSAKQRAKDWVSDGKYEYVWLVG
jgi:hypothetical protein